MTQTSRFWDGTTVGDAVNSPYDAETEFSQVLRDLRLTTKGTNRGAVITSIGSGLTAAGTAGSVTVQDGYAFVQGTWYHNDAPVAFTIPTPGSSTRVDRIVLRKNWTTQLVRLTQISGVEGAGEPALTQAEGTTWDIPICRASITTGGVITTTDERDVAAPQGASLFVPWVSADPFPTTSTGVIPTGGQNPYVLNGVPADATAVVVTMKITSGTVSIFLLSNGPPNYDTIFEATSTLNTLEIIRQYPILVPLPTPSTIYLGNGSGALVLEIAVLGWYVPIY